MSFETIKVAQDGGLVTVTLNRPQARNAIAGAMMAELYGELQRIAADPSVRVLVLRGEGRDFCPGADIGAHAGGGSDAPPPRAGYRDVREFDVAVLLHEMRAVTVAAIKGGCAGAGFGWACACDLRIADETARFNVAFLDVGVAGDMGATWTLPRIVGAGKARELCFFPGKFDAHEALRIGLVSKVSTPEAFEDDLAAFTGRLTAAAPIALATLKSNFVAAEKMGFSDYIAFESERHTRIFTTEDTREAFAAYAQKRKPVFHGR